MIEKNLGNIERIVRALMGLGLIIWAVVFQASMPLVEWFALIIATMLLLNGIFSRCFIWYVLDINSCKNSGDGQVCDPRL
jgi:hypothetical protein